jgi:hypothetical protein
MDTPPLLRAPSFDEVEQVVAEPLRFKARLAIGEDAYTSLRMINRSREVWDVLGAAGAGAAVAKTGLVAGMLGASATPIGWVALAALASGGACYGIYRLLGNTKGERVIEIPKYLNTPLDTLGLAIFDLIAPLSLRLAAVDGEIEAAERAFLIRYLVDDWGMNRRFVEQAVAAIEPRLMEGSIESMAAEAAEFLHLNPDCKHQAIAKDLGVFLRAMLETGGPLTDAEEEALATTVQLVATAPPGEMAEAWSRAMTLAGTGAGQVKTVLTDATGWALERLPSEQIKAGASEAATRAYVAARQATDWTRDHLPSGDQVKVVAGEATAQALAAARKAAALTRERLPSAEQVKTQAVEVAGLAAERTADVAKRGLAWAQEKVAVRLPKRDKEPPDAQ